MPSRQREPHVGERCVGNVQSRASKREELRLEAQALPGNARLRIAGQVEPDAGTGSFQNIGRCAP